MTIYINSCYKCAFYIASKTCLAFPVEIPDIIWTGKNKHEKNVIGDRGIKFKEEEIEK